MRFEVDRLPLIHKFLTDCFQWLLFDLVDWHNSQNLHSAL